MREAPSHVMRAGFVWASHEEHLEHLTRRFPLSRRMVERFVAGEDLDAAMAAVAGLRAHGLRTTLDVLGESVTDAASAEAAGGRYLELLDQLATDGADGKCLRTWPGSPSGPRSTRRSCAWTWRTARGRP